MKDYYQDPQVSEEHVWVLKAGKRQSDHRLIAYGSSHNGLTTTKICQKKFFFQPFYHRNKYDIYLFGRLFNSQAFQIKIDLDRELFLL